VSAAFAKLSRVAQRMRNQAGAAVESGRRQQCCRGVVEFLSKGSKVVGGWTMNE
jgi:hypothetical protein